MTQQTFPRAAFLVLGVLSLAAAAIFVTRAIVVEDTVERIVSAILFGGFGLLWLYAFWSER